MSIHFYRKDNTSQSIFKISDATYDMLQGSLNKFEKKTGIFIDPYGKVNLYPDNLRLLSEIIKDDFPQTNGGLKNEEIDSIFPSPCITIKCL